MLPCFGPPHHTVAYLCQYKGPGPCCLCRLGLVPNLDLTFRSTICRHMQDKTRRETSQDVRQDKTRHRLSWLIWTFLHFLDCVLFYLVFVLFSRHALSRPPLLLHFVLICLGSGLGLSVCLRLFLVCLYLLDLVLLVSSCLLFFWFISSSLLSSFGFVIHAFSDFLCSSPSFSFNILPG